MDTTGPRALRDPVEVQRRREKWLNDPELASLRSYVDGLAFGDRSVPAFDPDDAGTQARVLFVLEAPGPRSSAAKGSGFLSPDNNDATAATFWKTRTEAGLIGDSLHTNICPWYLGAASVKPSPIELAEGGIQLRRLLYLLPELQAVVLCGDYARRGWRSFTAPLIDGPGPTVIETHHPSPQGLIRGDRREHFELAVARAAALAGVQPVNSMA